MVNTPVDGASGRSYWRGVLRRTVLLLAVWFAAGPLLGILFVERLNAVTVGGVPVGFWISQQGAIYVFVALIFLYAWLSERADRREDGAERRSDAEPAPAGPAAGASGPAPGTARPGDAAPGPSDGVPGPEEG